MAGPILDLPIPLLLLVHLHLLEYPLANNPEYDQHLFDPNVRGLRDRTKSMEDTFHFLVGKIEGRRESAKTILPMYPCLAPADTTAFRTSLSKYLENLRHSAIYPKPGSVNTSSTRDKGKDKETSNTSEAIEAWWWKDVVGISSSSSVPASVALESTAALLRTQPHTYTTLLVSSQSDRSAWERSASLLQQRGDDLKLIHEKLCSHSELTPSKYDALSTDRLLALADAKQQDLIQNYWQGVEGRQALDFLIGLAGLQGVNTGVSDPRDVWYSTALENCTAAKVKPIVSIQPLPTAAAHHPSCIRKIRAPLSIFAPPKKNDIVDSSSTPRSESHASIALSARLENEKRVQTVLRDALARTRKIGEDLSARVNQMTVEMGDDEKAQHGEDFILWEERHAQGGGVNFNTKPAPELVSSFASWTAPPVNALELRINHIRGSLLPRYPAIPEPAAKPPQSRLPRPPKVMAQPLAAPALHDVDHQLLDALVNPDSMFVAEEKPPDTPSRLITSTPPASVKPRSAYAHRVLASQSKERRRGKGKVEFTVSTHSGALRRKSRKSVPRVSLVSVRRPSLFEAPLSDEDDVASDDEYGNDVERIVNAVQDESTSFQDSCATPKITRLPSPYKSKSASPFKKTNVTPGPRPSFKIIERQSLAPLPDGFNSADDLLHETHARDTDGEGTDDEDEKNMENDERGDDTDVYEGRSVTLRDILMQAGDTTQYDLLDGAGFELSDGSFAWG